MEPAVPRHYRHRRVFSVAQNEWMYGDISMNRFTRETLEEAVRTIEERASADPEFRKSALDHPSGALAEVLDLGATEGGLLEIVRHAPPFQIHGRFPRLPEADRLRAEMDAVAARLFT